MNSSYLSTKCEHVSILIPIMFTLKVPEDLNNIVQVHSSYNTHYKTRLLASSLLPSKNKTEKGFLHHPTLLVPACKHTYTLYGYLNECKYYAYLFSVYSQVDWPSLALENAQVKKWIVDLQVWTVPNFSPEKSNTALDISVIIRAM